MDSREMMLRPGVAMATLLMDRDTHSKVKKKRNDTLQVGFHYRETLLKTAILCRFALTAP